MSPEYRGNLKLSPVAPHFDSLKQPGDYFILNSGAKAIVVMACPSCAGVFSCHHEIVQREPLTLSPSVVGPESARNASEQVLAPCSHHFWVKDGEAREIS